VRKLLKLLKLDKLIKENLDMIKMVSHFQKFKVELKVQLSLRLRKTVVLLKEQSNGKDTSLAKI